MNLPLPWSQLTLKELNSCFKAYQDEENVKAIPTAQLARLTYNINRGKDSAALEDLSSFLPFPKRYEIAKALVEVGDISLDACVDFLNYYERTDNTRFKTIFFDWIEGLRVRVTE